MMDLGELYKEVIVDHSQHPRNFGRLEKPTHKAEGFNPICGDKITLYLHVDDNDVISEIVFEGRGCAISMASASLLTEALKGKTIEEANTLFHGFHALVTNAPTQATQNKLEKLRVFAGVKAFPSRVKCATLAWHTLQTALTRGDQRATTE